MAKKQVTVKATTPDGYYKLTRQLINDSGQGSGRIYEVGNITGPTPSDGKIYKPRLEENTRYVFVLSGYGRIGGTVKLEVGDLCEWEKKIARKPIDEAENETSSVTVTVDCRI